jgi:hypothetical protein
MSTSYFPLWYMAFGMVWQRFWRRSSDASSLLVDSQIIQLYIVPL